MEIHLGLHSGTYLGIYSWRYSEIYSRTYLRIYVGPRALGPKKALGAKGPGPMRLFPKYIPKYIGLTSLPWLAFLQIPNWGFTGVVSKNRSIESEILKNKIGALIYNSKQAKNSFLIDEVISLDDLIKKIIKQNKFKKYKLLENIEKKQSLLEKIFIDFNKNKEEAYLRSSICSKLKSNLVSIYSLEYIGC